jgi:hypothetical protein
MRTLFVAVCLLFHWPREVQRQQSIPEKRFSLIEAVNVNHGLRNRNTPTLLLRLRSDGYAEWETFAGTGKSKIYSRVILEPVLRDVKQRLDSIDQAALEQQSGPFATYVDTFDELKMDFVSKSGRKIVTLANPWGSEELQKLGHEKTMSADVKKLFCTIDLLRNSLAGSDIDSACKNEHLLTDPPSSRTKM